MNEDIKILKEKAERAQIELENAQSELNRRQRHCQHAWNQVKSDPEEIRIPSFSHYEGHGSDPNPVYTFSKGTKSRWSRECPLCGKLEYTYELKPTQYEPNFK